MNKPDTILLSPQELAHVTNGYWENLPKDLNITFVNFRTVGVKQGDLHISYNEENWNDRGSSENKLDKVFAQGAVAAVVRKKATISTTKPILRVDDTKKALKQIALATSEKSLATKVLVTGSFGKTGFKTQLYHLIKDQKNTNAVLNSANKDVPIYRALASIRKNDEIVIVEVAVPAPRRGQKRSSWINPNLCVITDIGLEHIKSHGGKIENVIVNKSEVAASLQKGGKFIIPQKGELTQKLKKSILKHGDFEILLFGEDNSCNAYIIKQEFNGFGWNITAQIESETIEYILPLLEEYAPKNSLAVLLTAYHLGINLEKAVKNYNSYSQYGSSGNFYKLSGKSGSFYLYDQSKRGEMDAFKSTLRLIKMMKPKNNARKIVILSEFTNLEEADSSIINIDEFKELINEANIDLLYTTHYFTEHINVLENKDIWKNHSFDINNIQKEIIDEIKKDDIVFIRGTLKSNLDSLVKKIIENNEIEKKYN